MIGKKQAGSSAVMIIIGMVILCVLTVFSPVQATEESSPAPSPSEAASATPAETPTPTASATDESAATDSGTVSPTDAGTATPAPTATSTPTATPVPTPTPTPVPTTPPKLNLLTPPPLSEGVVSDPSTAKPEGDEPEADQATELPDDQTALPVPSQESHIEQVEIDPGFGLSDFIQIVCYVLYGLAAFLLLFGVVRILILLLLKKDILPSRKERKQAKAEKQRQKAMKQHPMIQTGVSSDEYTIHKDDWNWK